MRFLRAKVSEFWLGVLYEPAADPDPIPTLFNEISLTRRRQAQISHPGFGRSFERVPTQGEAVTKGSPGGKHPTGKGAVRSPAFRLSAASRKATRNRE